MTTTPLPDPLTLEGSDATLEAYLETLLAGSEAGDYALPDGLVDAIRTADGIGRRYRRVGAELAQIDTTDARPARHMVVANRVRNALLAGEPMPEDITSDLLADEARIERLKLERTVLSRIAAPSTTEIVGIIRRTAESFGEALAGARRDLIAEAKSGARSLSKLPFDEPAALSKAPVAQQRAYTDLEPLAGRLARIEATAFRLSEIAPEFTPAAFVGSGRIRPSEPGTSAARQGIYHWTDGGQHPIARLIAATVAPVGPIGPRHGQQPVGATA